MTSQAFGGEEHRQGSYSVPVYFALYGRLVLDRRLVLDGNVGLAAICIVCSALLR